jgi:integrase
VPIHPALEPLFVDYLRIRAGDPEPALFVGVQGKRFSQTILTQTFLATRVPPELPSGLAGIIRRAADRAGIEKHVTAHTLRTAATWLRQQTGDARLVAAYLGHADLSTVSRYAHVAADELHDAAAALAARAAMPTAA